MALEFGTSMEHTMLADSIRRFARTEAGFEQRARRIERAHSAGIELWQPLADLGTLTVLIDPDRGGFGGTPADLAVVIEALAAALVLEPVLASGQMAGRVIHHVTSPAAQRLLDGISAGTSVPLLAHVEGHDPFAPPTIVAHAGPEGIRLTGAKPAVRHAGAATDLLVTACLDGTPAVLLVPASAPGATIRPTRMIDAVPGGDLTFDVLLDPDAVLELDVPVMEAVSEALDWGLAGLAVETASLIAAVNDEAFAYLNVREQFGVKLASFQALQHKTADMQIAAEEAAAMAAFAIEGLAEPISALRSIAILRASIAADKAGRLAAHHGVQLLGGMGVSDETPISHFARRLAAIRTQIGTVDARMARLIDLEDQAE